MSIAVFISSEPDCQTLIPWAARFARADETELVVVIARRSKTKEHRNEIAFGDTGSETPILAAAISACDSLDSHLFTRHTESSDEEPRTLIRLHEFVGQRPDHNFAEAINGTISQIIDFAGTRGGKVVR